ncbi:hypothetical protein LZ318_11725 [Saccharopolyspora indica]|uniref:hypothetical protein n=1 Tax=Saccharopolyspora indica TaxID=1229659 RepID=UPI0022EA3F5C|nr:hypothetical protein [Saccharopolyspora indica]MDA3643820.1 hypothetical protein [Saccharopolyspora indica]
MGYQEIGGGNGGSFEQREFVSAKIGTEFEGAFVDLGRLTEGQYGQYRVLAFDTEDGRKMACRASKILLERLEQAGLNPGDKLKVTVESATSKQGRTYALPRLFVSRSSDQAGVVTTPQQAAPKPVQDDEPPF